VDADESPLYVTAEVRADPVLMSIYEMLVRDSSYLPETDSDLDKKNLKT
jgi:hypothetical protein